MTSFGKNHSADINTAFVAAKKYDDNFNPVDVYRLDYFVLDYFNRLQVTHNINGGYSVFLYKKTQNYSCFYFWNEIETIANRIVEQFGPDKNLKAKINLQEERRDMREQVEWPPLGFWRGSYLVEIR